MTIIEAIKSKRVFGTLPMFKDLSTWENWLVCLKAAFALPMDDEELAIYRRYTGRENPPAAPFKELWFIVGRRGGKSFMAALVSVFLAVFVEWPLGLEKGYIMAIANDRRQASVVFTYIRRLLELRIFKGMVVSETREEIELSNNIVISVQTCSYRSLRGFQILACVNDEIGTWMTDQSANPAIEILRALRPSLGSMENSRLISISTGFQRSGPMWEIYRDKYSTDDPETLVWAAGTADMNPLYNQATIDKALKEDYQAAAVEYGIDGNFFRTDLEGFLSVEALEAVTAPGRLELAPQKGIDYVAGVDSSGGRGDAMVLTIVHKEGEKVIQDCIRAWFPPFNPEQCVKEFAGVVKEYGIHSVTGDKYAASFHSGAWEKHGITYKNSEVAKSDYYLEFLPVVMRGGCELLDHKRQAAEFRQLLRRTSKGKDSVDHPPNGTDDHSNACALAVVEASRPARSYGIRTIEHSIYPIGSDRYEDDGIDSGLAAMLRGAREAWRKR
jgi:hypothetical protein